MRKQIAGLLLFVICLGCGKSNEPQPPGAATLTAPAQNLVCTTGRLLTAGQTKIGFSWSAATNATSYDLTITNLLTQASSTQNVTTTIDSVTLFQNTPYSWSVTAKATRTSATTKSDVWKFYSAGNGVVTYPPYPATIISPTLGQIVTATGGLINLTWAGSSASGNITAYNLYFGPSNNPSLFKSNMTDSFLKNVSVSSGTTYYWHIATIDSNGNISDSGVFNFFVK
jgi:hypothetical protein